MSFIAKGERMKSTIETSEGLKRKLKIMVDQDKVKSAFEEQFEKIRGEVTLKGFRKGKAPLSQIKSMYREQVTREVVENLVNSNYISALHEHDLQPINYPKIDLDEIDEDKGFSFTAEIEVRPDVELKKYEGLEIEKEEVSIDKSRVQEVLDQILNSRAEKTPLLEDRPVTNGDFTDINFEGFLKDGSALPNGAAKNFILEIGSNSFIPGFEDGLVGTKAGEEKTISVTFPEDYHANEIAGANVDFKVTVNKILKKSLPELNDEFVKTLGDEKVQSVEDLKSQIKDDLEKSESSRLNQKLQEEVLKKLVEANPVEAPESLVTDQKESLKQNTTQTLKQQGLDDKGVTEYLAKWDAEFAQNAKDIIKSSLIVDAIAKKEKLQPTDADLEQRLQELAQGAGMEVSQVKEYYKEPGRMDSLRYRLLENKVIDFVLDKAQVKSVPAKNEDS